MGGYLNPSNGARYAAWVYPENSPGGSNVLKLLKFQSWTAWAYQGSNAAPIQEVSLPEVGTNWHTLSLALSNNQIQVSYDTNLLIRVADTEAVPYSGGGVSLDIWGSGDTYTMLADDVRVSSLAIGGGVNPGAHPAGQ